MPREVEPKGWHSRGYLPHFDSPECIQHIIFRTVGSLPRSITADISGTPEQRRKKYDEALDRSASGALLALKSAANIVSETLQFHESKKYHLFAWCIMPNHVHALIEPIDGFRLGDIVKEWKSFSARRINSVLKRSGALWTADYFDRMIRNEDQFNQTIAYIEFNPVAANLVETPQLWPWSSAYRSEP